MPRVSDWHGSERDSRCVLTSSAFAETRTPALEEGCQDLIHLPEPALKDRRTIHRPGFVCNLVVTDRIGYRPEALSRCGNLKHHCGVGRRAVLAFIPLGASFCGLRASTR